ncbi:Alpha-1,4-glucan:maltose-1-phosphate maltosyltransferase [Candidatus Izimaplasma bacterium HR1]|uniref:alpha-amylase family glycosyl hydrolase n=1 Tax=Candidatus Izimoplasma sp. HR1 TaxID=1541959 RepID=UPI0004F8D244|nr:Alpha-1,4-glucan:maltose-1-phosphate maltosyltransferase [Candidatus Izimaplasma bacterium HR1]
MSKLVLEKLLKTLKNNNDKQIYNYTVPDLWNCFDYDKKKYIRTSNNELMVNPYDFYASVIEDYILPNKKDKTNYKQSLSSNKTIPKRGYKGGDWIKQSVCYSTMIRVSSAWDFDRSGKLEQENIYKMTETGSFVKMLSLLPLLKKMGVDVVYMLPISKFSLKDKKGDLGSPYGVSNFNELDPNLKDPLTGDNITLEEEFKAFVEACHILDMRVMIDIIPRTNSVENDLIKEHPDWFYWIKDSEYDKYQVPFVEGVKKTSAPTIERMEVVYESKDTLRHIDMFQYDPKTQDEEKWNRIKDSKNISQAIAKEFDLRVAPAFSDHINDPQPPWTDVTFFRMYKDFPKETVKFLNTKNRAPYILFDTIKSNMYHGKEPNIELWETLADIVPSYQRRFGIDGARIDMGHALPKKLLNMIMEKAKEIDPDFSFIAEELTPSNAKKAKENGYNMIIGNGFIMEPRIWDGSLREFMYESIDLPIPTFACGETHDTPRLAARDGGPTLSKTLTVLNMFMPNAVPFINSGQEVYETQPMNTGLDARENELYMLPEDDPYYGKLALFDLYQFHYTNQRRWELPDLLEQIKPIRKKYLKEITNKKAFMPVYAEHHPDTFIGFSYIKKTGKDKKNILLILANSNPYDQQYLRVDIRNLRQITDNQEMKGKLLFSTHESPREFTQFIDYNTLDIHLGAGEVKIIEL